MNKCEKCNNTGSIECDTDRGTQVTECDCMKIDFEINQEQKDN